MLFCRRVGLHAGVLSLGFSFAVVKLCSIFSELTFVFVNEACSCHFHYAVRCVCSGSVYSFCKVLTGDHVYTSSVLAFHLKHLLLIINFSQYCFTGPQSYRTLRSFMSIALVLGDSGWFW